MTDSVTRGVVRRVLDNGLTLLVERSATAPVVAVVTHVRAGYFDEPDDWVGIAHVLEHMYFKGTPRRGPGELARETQRAGGYLNAATIYHKTVYYTVLPSSPDALAHAVDLQADALLHPALDADELARELEVIIQEARRKLDTPAALAGETLHELLFARHRIRRWRIGTEEGLRALGPEDVRRYYETRYTPDRTIISVVGDIDPEAALSLCAETYGGWVTGPAANDPSPAETDPPAPSLRRLRGDVERPLGVLGWRTVDTLHPDAIPLDLGAAVLGSGRGSWLSRAVRGTGLASQARAFHLTTPEVGLFEIAVEGDEMRFDEAVERAHGVVERFCERGPASGDLQRVRALHATQRARRLESMDGRATLWAECEALGDFHLADEFVRREQETSPGEVLDVCRKYLAGGAPCAVLYAESAFTSRLENAWPRPSPPDDDFAVPGPGPTVGTAVGVGPARPAGSEAWHAALDGVDVLARPKAGTGLVHIGVYVQGIRDAETLQTAGAAALFARTSVRGAAGLSREELVYAGESLGGVVQPVVSSELLGWRVTLPVESARGGAELVRSVAAEATLASDEIALERRLQASDAARQRDDMFGYPCREVLGLALPGTPYGLPVLGDPDLVSDLTDDQVRDVRDRVAGQRLLVVVVGDLAREPLVEVAAPFASWPGRSVPPANAAQAWTPGRGAEERAKEQTATAMAFPCGPYGSPDRGGLEVLGSYLSGLAGKLFTELRDKRSLAYTVTAVPWLRRPVGAFVSYIATSPSREEEARDAMLDCLAGVATDPLDEADVERARNAAAGALQLRLQSSESVAGELVRAFAYGDLEELSGEAERLRAVRGDDLRRIAGEVFVADRRAEFVVRGVGRG